MEEEKISIIMSAYNSSKTIGRAIESCLNQTYSNFELIIVDDCSTDETIKVINGYDDDRIRLVKHYINKGCGEARCTGLSNITGDYTVFLDSDDYLLPTCLEHQLKALKHNNADMSKISYVIGFNDINKNYSESLPDKVLEGRDKYIIDNPIADKFILGSMISSKIWNNVKYCNRRYDEDTPTLVKCLFYANKIVKISSPEYVYNQNEYSLVHTSYPLKDKIYQTLTAIDNYNFAVESNSKDLDDFKSLSTVVYRIKDIGTENINEQERLKYKEELSIIATFLINHL